MDLLLFMVGFCVVSGVFGFGMGYSSGHRARRKQAALTGSSEAQKLIAAPEESEFVKKLKQIEADELNEVERKVREKFSAILDEILASSSKHGLKYRIDQLFPWAEDRPKIRRRTIELFFALLKAKGLRATEDNFFTVSVSW